MTLLRRPQRCGGGRKSWEESLRGRNGDPDFPEVHNQELIVFLLLQTELRPRSPDFPRQAYWSASGVDWQVNPRGLRGSGFARSGPGPLATDANRGSGNRGSWCRRGPPE